MPRFFTHLDWIQMLKLTLITHPLGELPLTYQFFLTRFHLLKSIMSVLLYRFDSDAVTPVLRFVIRQYYLFFITFLRRGWLFLDFHVFFSPLRFLLKRFLAYLCYCEKHYGFARVIISYFTCLHTCVSSINLIS